MQHLCVNTNLERLLSEASSLDCLSLTPNKVYYVDGAQHGTSINEAFKTLMRATHLDFAKIHGLVKL